MTEGDVIQSPFGDALITGTVDSGIGVQKYVIQVSQTGQLHTAFRHQLFPIDVIDDFDQELEFEEPTVDTNDQDHGDEDVENWINEISFGDVPQTDKEDTLICPDFPHDIATPSTSAGIEPIPSTSSADDFQPQPKQKKRFVQPDTLNDIQHLVDGRKARVMEYQTRWAVKIFRGNFFNIFLTRKIMKLMNNLSFF